MSEIRHTPGPWRAEKWLCHLATSVTVDDASIVTGKRLIVECETEEDARLIAASPDLLDAAQAAEAVLARGRWIEGSTDPEAIALAKLRAAIAKATEIGERDRFSQCPISQSPAASNDFASLDPAQGSVISHSAEMQGFNKKEVSHD
jgi:hypothetical protein